MSDNEFIFVSKKKGFKPQNYHPKQQLYQKIVQVNDINEQNILSISEQIKCSPMFLQILSQIQIWIQSQYKGNQINLSFKCLGLGSVSQSQISLIQIVTANCILDYIQNLDKNKINVSTYLFDPVFDENDFMIFNQFFKGFQFEQINFKESEQVYKLNQNEICIFFMPHGEKEMHKDILFYNQTTLQQVILIGNSIQGYIDRAQLVNQPVFDEFIKYQNNLIEVKLSDFEPMYLAFNDTYITKFN